MKITMPFVSRLLARAAGAILCVSLAAAAFAADPCGTVKECSGGFGTTREDRYVALAVGDDIFEFDVVKTEAGGAGTIEFVDGTMLELRESSEIVIKEVVSTEERSRFNVGVAEGAARIVTGSIVRRNPRGFKVKTPSATIGIRGTDLTVSYSSVASMTSVNVAETATSVSVTDAATGVSVSGATGLSVSMSVDGTATINGVQCNLNDVDSLAEAAARTGVSISDTLGSPIGGAASDGGASGGDSSGGGGGDAGGDGNGGSSSSGGSSSGDCGSSNSSPGR